MNLDIRLPIGLLFALLGGLLLLYGLATQFTQPELYERSLGININIGWGLVMLLFGSGMIWLGRRGTTAQSSESGSVSSRGH